MNRLLDLFDDWARRTGVAGLDAPHRPPATEVDSAPTLALDLADNIRTVIWATGMRPDHSWLDLPVFDRRGGLKHRGGVVDAPGVYVLGLPLLRRRKSSFIHGAADDVRELVVEIAAHLGLADRRTTRQAGTPAELATTS